MNNKSEYNRCALPRLTCKLGEKDLEKWRQEDKLELAKEATIEEKIRERKKVKNKARGSQNRRMELGQPKRKRMRMGEDINKETGEDSKEDKIKTMKPVTPTKRKVTTNEKIRTPKKARKNHDIKQYISCKRWVEEAKLAEGQGQVDGQVHHQHRAGPQHQQGTPTVELGHH